MPISRPHTCYAHFHEQLAVEYLAMVHLDIYKWMCHKCGCSEYFASEYHSTIVLIVHLEKHFIYGLNIKVYYSCVNGHRVKVAAVPLYQPLRMLK